MSKISKVRLHFKNERARHPNDDWLLYNDESLEALVVARMRACVQGL